MFVHRKGCHPKDRGRTVERKSYRGKGIQRISCTALGGKSASQISRDPEEIKAEDILCTEQEDEIQEQNSKRDHPKS